MAKTSLQKKLSYYDKLIADSKNSPLAGKYGKVCSTLEELVTLSKKLNKPEINMTPDDFANLTSKYQLVQQACNEFLGEKSQNSFDKSYAVIVKNIANVLNRDIKTLEQCNSKEPGSLSDIIKKSRTHMVHIKKRDIQTEGGALSQRIPIKTNSGVKGFFTAKVTYNIDKKWSEEIDKFTDRFGAFSETYKKNLEKLKTNENMIDVFCRYNPGCKTDEFLRMGGTKSALFNRLGEVAKLIGMDKTYVEMNNPEKQVIREFVNAMSSMANQYNFMKAGGIKKDSNLSDRNCAMTDIAKLLKCSHILANSVPMTIDIDGEKVEGVFMETAEGTDIGRLKEDDDILDARANSFKDYNAIGQILDLQVLDYICGNIDRHPANMIYQFGRNQNNKVVLKGIKGIDNDCSLGTPDIQSKTPIQDMVKPEDMQFIRNDTLQIIMGLKPEAVQMKLQQYELSDEEKNAVWQRIEKVREAFQKGKIKVVGKTPYDMNYVFNRNKKVDNYLKKIEDMAEACDIEKYADYQKGNNEVHYMKDRQMANKVMFGNQDRISELRAQMNKAKAVFFSSSEYKMMEKRFEKIEILTNEIKQIGDPEKIPEETAIELNKAYKELEEKAMTYLQLKKIVPSTTRGIRRMELAQSLMDFAQDTLYRAKSEPKKEVEVQNETTKETEVKKEESKETKMLEEETKEIQTDAEELDTFIK